MALPVSFDPQGFPIVNAILGGAAPGAGALQASAPTHGVTTAIANDNSTLVATVQVGKRYRVTVIGGEGVVLTNSAGPAARATDDPFWAAQKWELVAVHTQVYGQKLVAGTANLSVNVTPLDGGTIA